MAAEKNDNYVKIFLEFVEVVIHQVIYHRDIYPVGIFAKKKKYQTPLVMSEHPWVNEYIDRTLKSIESQFNLPESNITSILVVVADTGIAKEKIFIELDNGTLKKPISVHDEFLIKLEMTFVSMILRLNQALAEKKITGSNLEWWIELATTENTALKLTKSLEWGLASSTSRVSPGQILPVMAVDHPIWFQIYVETCA